MKNSKKVFNHRKLTYSIRKFAIGTGSVIIGSTLIGFSNLSVSADIVQPIKPTTVAVNEEANYTYLEATLAQVPKDLSRYSKDSVSRLQEVLAQIDGLSHHLAKSEQAKVDEANNQLYLALSTLQTKSQSKANYDALEQVMAGLPLDLSPYTDSSVANLQAVIAEVKQLPLDLTEENQSQIDKVVLDVKAAAMSLVVKPVNQEKADFSFLDKTIAQVPKDLSPYTESSVANLQNALLQVEFLSRDTLASEQSRVDNANIGVQAALKSLVLKTTKVLKKADYSHLKATATKTPSDLSLYTDESVANLQAIQNKIDQLPTDLTEDQQNQVDEANSSLQAALQSLVLKPVVQKVSQVTPTEGEKEVGITQPELVITKESIPFKTIEKENPNLEKGQRHVLVKGENGEKELAKEVIRKGDTEEVLKVYPEQVTKKAVDQVVEVGSLSKVSQVTPTEGEKEVGITQPELVVTKESIPFKTIEKENPNLEKGQRHVLVKGENGEQLNISIVVKDGDKIIKSQALPSQISKEVVNQVIEVGSLVKNDKSENSQTISKLTPDKGPKVLELIKPEFIFETEEIPYKTIEKSNPNLEQGSRHIIQKGHNGQQVVTKEVYKDGDTIVDSKVVSKDITKQSTNEIVEVGTKRHLLQNDVRKKDITSDKSTQVIQNNMGIKEKETRELKTAEQQTSQTSKDMSRVSKNHDQKSLPNTGVTQEGFLSGLIFLAVGTHLVRRKNEEK